MNNFEYTLPKNAPITTEELQNDLKQVAEKVKVVKLFVRIYKRFV
jgi:hypothetical protein